MPDSLTLYLDGGLAIRAPASLSCATTYVLLEHEDWFEKETVFVKRWLEPGMVAVDIGANHGAYALPMAARVGPTGQVYAYEPASRTLGLLEESRALNGLEAALTVVGAALSNRVGHADLHLNAAGAELNAIVPSGGGGPHEKVALSTLDAEAERLGWDRVDFIKIDAEGEEARIVEGGRRVLEDHAPLVMFEIVHAEVQSFALVEAFQAMGYGIYRATGDGAMLAPWRADEHEAWELNLFAATPERAAALEAAGLLAGDDRAPITVSASDWRWCNTQPWATAAWPSRVDPAFGQALGAYAQWRDLARAPSDRFSALQTAIGALVALCEGEPTAGRLSTLVRAAEEGGRRTLALQTLQRLWGSPPPQGEPFVPLHPLYDAPPPAGREAEWFAVCVAEQLELLSSRSSLFLASRPFLSALSTNDLACGETLRRQVLQMARRSEPVPDDLCARAAALTGANAAILTPARLAELAGA